LSPSQAELSHDTPQRVDALIAQAWECRHQDVPQAQSLLQTAAQLAQRIDHQQGLAYTMLRLALCDYMRREDALGMEMRLQQALSLMRSLGDTAGEAEALNLLGNVLTTQARFEEGIATHQLALALRRRLGNLEGEAGSLNNIALALRHQGQPAEALEHLLQSQAVARTAGDFTAQAYAQVNVGSTLLELADPAAALDALDRALELVRATSDRALECTTQTQRGLALGQLNRRDEALSALEKAMALARRTGNRGDLTRVHLALGQVLMDVDETAAAQGHLRTALEGARGGGDLALEPEALLRLAQARLRMGDADEAARLGDEVLALAQRRQDVGVLADAHQLLSQVHEARGDAAASLQHLQNHLEYAQQRSGRHALRRAHAALARHEIETARREAQQLQDESLALGRELEAARDTSRRQADLLAELAAQSELLQQLAREDGLTGVANRRWLDAQVTREAERSRRFEHPLSVAMIDIDDFKAVNDRCGHAIGDTVLREVARLLRDSCRLNDLVARYGGEEFAVVMVETTPDNAAHLADKLRQRVHEHDWPGVHPQLQGITVSIGIAGTAVGHDAPTRNLLAEADTALYAAKRAGKNVVRGAPGQGAPAP
jgi:diguanylate cyclase (GGDEF)-like protein